MAATNTPIYASSLQTSLAIRTQRRGESCPQSTRNQGSSFFGSLLPRGILKKKDFGIRTVGKVIAAVAVEASPTEEMKEVRSSKLFYNPAATKLVPNDDFGIAFNGGFNQPIMCGGEPRAMLRKDRGKADGPIYTIQICVPKHAINLIFSFTNGVDWDGPYRLQFQVPKPWQNKPIDFFNQGLAEELSKEGACDRAIFPDTNIVITRCAMIGNLNVEGGDRCELDLVLGCTDPSSHLFNPYANVDDGSCPIDTDTED
ncbi:hypothetical protein SDJN02_24315, partial [Cucurbita argyrosperma subsp. argyrosperma]